MFGSPSKKVQAVQVLNTKPMTKSQYYAQQLGRTAIAFTVLSLIALVLSVLVITGVIHAKGYTDEIANLSNFANHVELAYTPMPLTDEFFTNAIPSSVVNALKEFVASHPNWTDIVTKQDNLSNVANIVLVVSIIATVVFGLGIGVCAFVGNLDVQMSAKKEAKYRNKLKTFEYKVLQKVIAAQNKQANKELKAQKLAEYKSKKK